MSRRWTARARALLAALLVATSASAAAAAPAAPPRRLSPSKRLQQAKEEFERGLEALDQGRIEDALGHFLRSHELVPSYGNTRNAANCLDILERHDEALAMYEALLDGFEAELSREERVAVDRRMAELAAEMGALVIEANVDGEVFIDGRPRARLPLDRSLRVMRGRHRIRVVRPGYEPFETTVDIAPGVPMLVEARLRLTESDEAPPPPPPPSAFAPGWFIEAFGGYAAGPNLGSDAEAAAAASCPSGRCPGAGGPWIGVRGGYLLESGLAFELSGAFLDMSSSFRRSIDIPDPDIEDSSIGSYQLDHRVLLRESLFGAGVSYHLPIAWRVSGLARMTLALGSALAADEVRGVAAGADGQTAPALIGGRQRTLRATTGLVIPELGLEASWGPLRAGVSVGLLISPSKGPRYGRRVLGVGGACMPTGMGGALPLTCAPDSTAIAYERAYGPFLLWVPQLSAAVSF